MITSRPNERAITPARAAYRRTVQLLVPRWRLTAATALFSALSASSDAGFAIVAGGIAQWLFREAGASPQASSAEWPHLNTGGAELAISVGLVTVLRMCGTLGAAWTNARLGNDVAHELRVKLYARAAHNAVPRTVAHHRADLVDRLQNDVAVIQNALTYAVSGLAHTALSTVLVGALIITIDPLVGLACFVGTPFAILFVRYVNRRFSTLYEAVSADRALMEGRVEEIIDTGDVVRSMGAEERLSARFAGVSARVRETSLTLAWVYSLTKPVVSVAAALGVIGLVVHWSIGSAPPAAEQASLLAAAAILVRPVHMVSDLLGSIASARSSMIRVDEILRIPLPPSDASAREVPPAVNLLEAEDLAFSFDGRPVFSGLSFRAQRGQSVAVVGASGAGKTTLLRLVAGLLEPERGSLRIDGQDSRNLGTRKYRSYFGWVPQEARLLTDTVIENLRLGRPDADAPELNAALRAVGMEQPVAALPQGLDTLVGDDGSPFSVGQRQRLCIARALIAHAPVLILDEPTAALDERRAEDLHHTIAQLLPGIAVLIATHRLSSVRKCDWVLLLENGAIAEQGTPADLVTKAPLFRRLFAQDLVTQRPTNEG